MKTKQTLTEYTNANVKSKSVWYWPTEVYVVPFALTLDAWETYWKDTKKLYPVQYFLRETVFGTLESNFDKIFGRFGKIRNAFYQVVNFFCNPRREMRANVFPSTYQDLDSMIYNFSAECVVELVEREKYFESYPNSKVKFNKELKKYYSYVKKIRDKMHDDLEKRYKKTKDIKIWIKGGMKIEKLDTEFIVWVAENRKHFWT